MEHPTAIRPQDHAVYRADKMGKATLFRSERMLVGLNAFEPGQEHALHAHAGMDKLYQVIEGEWLRPLDPRTETRRVAAPVRTAVDAAVAGLDARQEHERRAGPWHPAAHGRPRPSTAARSSAVAAALRVTAAADRAGIAVAGQPEG